jgi:4-amino-4-deoxy-L-arabinose transferase-like glycosyltransferase
MHWPGASVLLVLGVVGFSLIFLPLMFALKTKEMDAGKDKIITGIGFLIGILHCMGVLFKVQHWPGANIMMFGGLAALAFIFTPLYFFNGYAKPERRLNTTLTTIILIAIAGVQFLLVRVTRPQPAANEVRIHAEVQK